MKLSKVQKEVMKWLKNGWYAYSRHSGTIQINGQRICRIDTITALIRLGLVEEADRWSWRATEAGKAIEL